MSTTDEPLETSAGRFKALGTEGVPPHAYFLVSAVFHYLGPAFAVLLFALVEPLGVAWLRIASAALIFAVWRRPWRTWRSLDRRTKRLLIGWGAVLAVMNSFFYLAIDRLPLGTVAAIEFLPVVALAALAARTRSQPASYGRGGRRGLPAHRRSVGRRASGVRLRRRQRAALRRVHHPGPPGRPRETTARDRRTCPVDADRRRDRAAHWRRRGHTGLHQPRRAGRRDRCRHLVVGHSLHLRPAGHAPLTARHLRLDGVAAARHRHRDRHRRAGPDPECRRMSSASCS